MDWKHFVDHFSSKTCVLSVEKRADGGYGTIRIVTGNDVYLDSLALAAGGEKLDSTRKTTFVPNSEYTKYIPKDLNFEDACYRCAVLKEPAHSCVRPARYPFDIITFFLPMESDDERLAYCTCTMVFLEKDDDHLMSLNISRDTAADVISTCIKLHDDKPFQEIMQEVIDDIRKLCSADRCCVLLMDNNLRKCSVLAESMDPNSGLAGMNTYVDDDFFDIAESWLDTIGGSYCLVIRDENDMEYIRERNPRWHAMLKGAHVERLVIFPLTSRGQFLGYIWATNFEAQNTLRIKDTLELTTYFIASEIASHHFVEQLKMLSKIDLLTGVMNRNEMNNRVNALAESSDDTPCHLGIVFADMNGLKYVNDTLGHAEGDHLLKNAAMILKSTFIDDEIYRVGGDEFMILLHKTDEADLQDKILEIKKKSGMFEHVSFSAGYSLLKRRGDIREALEKADSAMYEDKQRYYQSGGITR